MKWGFLPDYFIFPIMANIRITILQKKRKAYPTCNSFPGYWENARRWMKYKKPLKRFAVSASTVHWRFTDTSGHQLVLEIINGVPEFYENKLGVLTNSPGFEWQLTNLNNYVNLFPGTAPAQHLGNIELSSFGAGSGFLGIPGDVTPPSRFVRAAFYQTSAPQQDTPLKTVLQCFQILNNFDIPVGIEFKPEEVPCDIPSATQWTSATDMTNRIIYFRTMYNSAIRSIDLNTIDFTKVHYQAKPMDIAKQQPVETIKIK